MVLGLFAILGAMTAVVGSSDLRGSALHSERDLAVNLLQKTRARALANIGEHKHGVYIDNAGGQYIVFAGNSFDTATDKEEIPFYSDNVTKTNAWEVVFSQLDGQATVTGDLQINGISTVISINPEGQISWTN